jgi:hypothetical protein
MDGDKGKWTAIKDRIITQSSAQTKQPNPSMADHCHIGLDIGLAAGTGFITTHCVSEVYCVSEVFCIPRSNSRISG